MEKKLLDRFVCVCDLSANTAGTPSCQARADTHTHTHAGEVRVFGLDTSPEWEVFGGAGGGEIRTQRH